MGTPFKMQGFSGFGNSPLKQNPKKTYKRIQKMKSKSKEFVKKLNIKKIAKTGGKGNVLSLILAATKTATADQPKFPKGSVHYMDPKNEIKFGE